MKKGHIYSIWKYFVFPQKTILKYCLGYDKITRFGLYVTRLDYFSAMISPKYILVWKAYVVVMMTSWHTHKSVLLTVREGNPAVNGGFPSQRASNIGFECFLCYCSVECWTKSQFTRDMKRHDAPAVPGYYLNSSWRIDVGEIWINTPMFISKLCFWNSVRADSITFVQASMS